MTTHQMNLNPEPFAHVKSGAKRVEMRLYDEKRRAIKPLDVIEFTHTVTGEILRAQVVDIAVFDDFNNLYKHYTKQEIGYLDDEIANPDDMLAYYSRENISKYGVCAIRMKIID